MAGKPALRLPGQRNSAVIARQSAFAFKGRFVDVQQVGRELGVAYIVEGTVRRGGEPEREMDAARRAIDAAAGLIEDDPTALTAAGAATGFCGDQEGAAALIEQTLALDPNNARAWTRWGWLGTLPAYTAMRWKLSLPLGDPFGSSHLHQRHDKARKNTSDRFKRSLVFKLFL